MTARHARRRSLGWARSAPGLRAAVGDRITLLSTSSARPVRAGVVVEVQNGDGSPPYVVHWLDNNERALVYPGANSVVERVPRSA
jgi:hypothetical protein